MNEFVKLIEEYFDSVFNLNVFIGIIAAIVVLVFELNYMNKHNTSNKKIEKAKQLGNVVTAKRIHTWTDNRHGTSMDSWVYATYTYDVAGKSYRYKYMDRQFAPVTLTLYYVNSPRKVFRCEGKKNAFFSLLFYLVPIAVAVIIINLLGGI